MEMRQLSPSESDEYRFRLQGQIGEVILNLLARNPQRLTGIVRHLEGWAPHNEDLAKWIEGIVTTLERRGDVERHVRGTYRVLPPYVVGMFQAGQPLYLFGHPGCERIIEAEFHLSISRLEPAERIIKLPSDSSLRPNDLEQSGIRVLRVSDLLEGISAVRDLVVPAEDHLAPADVVEGTWEHYSPVSLLKGQLGTWKPIATVNQGERLLRWTPRSFRFESDRRYFIHGGYGRCMEISTEEGILWQWELARQTGVPRKWRYSTSAETLAVGGTLPRNSYQTLRVLSSSRVNRDGLISYFSIPSGFLSLVHELARRLGSEVQLTMDF